MTDPNFPIERIRRAHAPGLRRLSDQALEAEPVEVALAAERHRWAWRPAEVRVFLIAESPVFTSQHDFTLKIRYDELPVEAQHAPTEFVRLIHCLGYGHNKLLVGGVAEGNYGTRDFWQIFGRVACTLAEQPRTGSTLRNWLEWKVWTLLALQAAGVWLLDASVHGIYAPKGKRVPKQTKDQLHVDWWEHYGHWLVDQWPTAQRWVVGKTVHDPLTALGVPFDGWIYQPRAGRDRRIDMETGWPELLRAVGSHALPPKPTFTTPSTDERAFARSLSRDRTRFVISVDGQAPRELGKGRSILALVRELCSAGITFQEIGRALEGIGPRNLYTSQPGKVTHAEMIAFLDSEWHARGPSFAARRYFRRPEDLIVSGPATYVLSNQWGPKTAAAIERLLKTFPEAGIKCSPATQGAAPIDSNSPSAYR